MNIFQWFRLKMVLQSWNLAHMEVYNGRVLARICSCCADEDIQDGIGQPFWIILSFIKSSFFMKQRWNLAKTSQFRSGMTQFLQISLTTSRNKIFKMASDNHNLLSYFPKIIKYQKAKMKFGKKLHKKVHNGCVLARICNCHGNKDIQDGVRQPFWIILSFIKSSFFMKQT